MGLKPTRNIRWRNYEDFTHPRTSERGGVLTISEASGIYYADYSIDPSGRAVLGIKLDDHEWIEDERQPNPGRLRRAERYFSLTRIVVEGEVITDWVHPDYSSLIRPGNTAFVGPSGTLVNSDVYGSSPVGVFLSTVGSTNFGLNNHDSYTVLLDGGGLSYTWMEPYTHQVKSINSEQIFVPVGGWVKLWVNLKSK